MEPAVFGRHGTSRECREPAAHRHIPALGGLAEQTFYIFEGTEQIQQLVISRAITGLRVE
jgi:alkylation response protein AidB-like acyl-CoA dehydrogenase